MLNRPFALVVATAAAGVSGMAAASAGAPLSHLILRSRQVGPTYKLEYRADSHGVQDYVTLDMCGTTFQSETMRTARLQVDYTRKHSTLRLSNEVVKYRRDGATLAMREIRRSVTHCPRTPVRSYVAGLGPVRYRIQNLRSPKGLLRNATVLLVRMSGPFYGRQRTVTSVVVYQARGRVLSAVYGFGLPVAAQERLVLHAAVQSATNLRRGVGATS